MDILGDVFMLPTTICFFFLPSFFAKGLLKKEEKCNFHVVIMIYSLNVLSF